MSPRSRAVTHAALPQQLIADLEQAGYYPLLVADVVAAALGDEPVRSHLVQAETTLDGETVRRHITVLALTDHRLIIAHADDHMPTIDDQPVRPEPVATATTESVALSAVRGVMLAHVVSGPESYQPGSLGREVTITIGWGTMSRVDLLPATCGDPTCDADHGYDGTITSDDISLRVSADADGDDVLAQALEFAAALSAAVGR